MRFQRRQHAILRCRITIPDLGCKVYNNFNNENLSLERKFAQSAIDSGAALAPIVSTAIVGAWVGSYVAIPGHGTAAGMFAGLWVGVIIENSSVVVLLKSI